MVAVTLIASACLIAVHPSVAAQTSTDAPPAPPAWTYGGFTDIGYLFAPNDPLNKLFRSRGTAWHLNDVHLNMAAVFARRPATNDSRWGGELTLQAGKDDEIFGFSATAPNLAGSDWLRHLGPTSVSYLAEAGRGLTLQGGIFSSLIGYDSLYAKDNINYTRPWGADFTPYLMLGVNASYPITDKLTGTAFIVNGYWHLADANAVPSSGMQIAYAATPRVTLKETVMAGPHQSNTSLEFWRFVSDTIVERRADRLVMALNFHFATERVDQVDPLRAWWVAAQLPVQWHVSGPWRLAIRPEVAWDTAGRWTLAEQTVKALTTTLEYRASGTSMGTSIRFEHRVDTSTGPQGGFFDHHEIAPGVPALTPTQHLVILGVVIRFDRSSR